MEINQIKHILNERNTTIPEVVNYICPVTGLTFVRKNRDSVIEIPDCLRTLVEMKVNQGYKVNNDNIEPSGKVEGVWYSPFSRRVEKSVDVGWSGEGVYPIILYKVLDGVILTFDQIDTTDVEHIGIDLATDENYSLPVEGDSINPDHYTHGGIETIDYLQAKLSAEEFKGFLKGNVLKYLSRAEKKNGAEDYKKAQWYMNKLVEVYGE